MRIDIIEVKSNKNKTKVIILTILAILFIVSASVLGIYYAKSYKLKLIADKNIDSLQDEISSTKNSESKKEIEEKIKEKTNKTDNIYDKDSKIAYLTFDDGPSQAVTPLILDLLKKENIKATFFVLGSNVKKNPDLVKRAYQEGHYIANHGYSHDYKKIYKNAQSVLEEFNKTEKQIQKAIENNEYSSHLFRFPGRF